MSLDVTREPLVTVSASPPRDAPVQGDEGPEWLDRSAYPFVNRYLDTSSARFHYVDEGQGEPVLFVHGTPSWSFEFRHLIRALRAHRRCIAPDLLGFGLSSRPRRFEYTPEAHTRALTEFVERLGLRRFALVVHDFGGCDRWAPRMRIIKPVGATALRPRAVRTDSGGHRLQGSQRYRQYRAA